MHPRFLASLVVLACACPGSTADSRAAADPATAGDAPAEPAIDPAIDMGLAGAHDRALARFRDAALPALAAFDPVAAAAIGRGELSPPPATRADREALREAMKAARREREGIDPSRLSPERAMLLRALEHGTHRIDDELSGKTPLRTEPGAYLVRLDPLLARIERSLASGDDPAAATAAIARLGDALAEVGGQLGAASPAATTAAIADARALAARLRRIPSLPPSEGPALAVTTEAVAARADALVEHLEAIAAALPSARPAARADRLAPSADPTGVRRLPDPLGDAGVAALLEREAVADAPSVLLARVVATVGRLAAMADDLPSPVAAPAEPVTAARCEVAWRPIAAFVAENPVLSSATLDCEALVRRMHGRELDDGELAIEVVEDGVVRPTRDARRREVDRALALVGGDITPDAQRRALTISVLVGAKVDAAARRAIEDARDAACLAGAALLVHAGPTSSADVLGRLGEACGHRSAEAWTADALARPARSLRGLGLTLVGSGPADALAMQRFWWAPMGLVGPLAAPPPLRTDEPPPPTNIEELSKAP